MQQTHSRHSPMTSAEPSTSQQQMEIHQTEERFKLVKNDFTRLGQTPYLIKKNNPVILKGPNKRVRSGADEPKGLFTNSEEKRVKLPQDLLTFIKSSRAIFKYESLFQQRLRRPVFIEVESDLVLSSLCPRDLDEALAVVVTDLSMEIEKLQGSAAVPPDIDRIKEALTKAKKEANRDEMKVDFSFIPGQNSITEAKVRLVGYTEDVSKLRGLLRDYLRNWVSNKLVLNLPHPEMVDCFDRILEMIRMKQTKATLKASRYPHPCVTVSGPRCHVQETHLSLTSALAGLRFNTLVLDGSGALRYFQADGKTSKDLVESSCQVLIQERQVLAPSRSANLSILRTSPTSHQSAFLFVGLDKKNVEGALTKMKDLYQAHSSTKTFTKDELADLTQDDMNDLVKLAEIEGLFLHEVQGGLTVSGLKAGVNQVVQKLQTIIPFRREMRIKEEENLYPHVAWCILGQNKIWERLPKRANYDLEKCKVTKGIVDAQGVTWSVNVPKMEAKIHRQTAKLKRLKNLPDFTLPLYWDNMADNENLKVVTLEPSSAEYQAVQQAFNNTVQNTIVKIERLQNVHLRRIYEMQKKHISEKNRSEGGAGEKLLYHGTSQENCNSIKTKGFNRSFSGRNAPCYGQGTYFAVNACYSAAPTYSTPAADGTQAVFVARVLTGVYTQGHSNMRVPPPRNSQQPDECYDSVVDRTNNPNMFVVFHDDQAYPDYLITFR